MSDNIIEPDADELEYAREDLGPDATDAEVREVATRRMTEKVDEMGLTEKVRALKRTAIKTTYAVASALVGQSLQYVAPGRGSTRHVTFRDGGLFEVRARIFDTDIAIFRPEGVEIHTGGYVTASTFDALATALGIGRGIGTICGTYKRVPYVLGHELHEGMILAYDGTLLEPGGEMHLAPARRRRSAGERGLTPARGRS